MNALASLFLAPQMLLRLLTEVGMMFESWAASKWMDVRKLEDKRSDISGLAQSECKRKKCRRAPSSGFCHPAMLRTCSIFVNLRKVLIVNVGREAEPLTTKIYRPPGLQGLPTAVALDQRCVDESR